MKVTLRDKKIKHGKRSLYLDFYPPVLVDGKKTRREFLRLYLFEKPSTEIQRSHNKETKMLAQSICAKRQLDLQANPHGFISPRRKKESFIAFFQEAIDRRKHGNKNTLFVWKNTLNYLKDFCGRECTFAQIDPNFLERFRDYLLNCQTYKSKNKKCQKGVKDRKLSRNTAKNYFERVCSIAVDAYNKKYISENPIENIKPIKGVASKREFLLLEELRTLAATNCNIPNDLRRAALFSAMTGLRHSDIKNLRWQNVRKGAEGYFLDFVIQKTKEFENLPISDDARELLGTRRKPNEKVFTDLKYNCMTNIHLERWAKASGIERRITFHAFRHTFATGLISGGTDLYTVSKMLGHRDIKTTQIYARLLDEKKREAANKISLK